MSYTGAISHLTGAVGAATPTATYRIAETFLNRPGGTPCFKPWLDAQVASGAVKLMLIQNSPFNGQPGTDPANDKRYFGIQQIADKIVSPNCPDSFWHGWDGQTQNLEQYISPGGPGPTTTGDLVKQSASQTLSKAEDTVSKGASSLKQGARFLMAPPLWAWGVLVIGGIVAIGLVWKS